METTHKKVDVRPKSIHGGGFVVYCRSCRKIIMGRQREFKFPQGAWRAYQQRR